ncbi:hypothetical protein GUITHDRAFT_105177 [Guillardia theta CCMP2712]|uniref:Uncharacterized protein n=1 Tax=Guillardia theta (strain CCMP2712) TaxID=905079 RepID=L1JKR0_GUITC|nr:hypothetical protein GUITHDRAFT_105177 [Guillardia theta CCMP2712]EKX49096.1 hypothetical protein GUITHDRAFT_105177 [Guillardia theta CCMP2712]|eukprot:XP_005836076.1 hypothetical protein GUITHDRAFT_105177 [Guillardia theta CCMP2712]
MAWQRNSWSANNLLMLALASARAYQQPMKMCQKRGPELRQYKAGDSLRLGLCLTFKEDNLRLGTLFKDLIRDPERDIYRVGTCQQAFSDVNIQRGEYIYFEFCEDPRKLFHVIYNMCAVFSCNPEILPRDARLAAMGILFNGTREQFDDAGRVAPKHFLDVRDCGLMFYNSAEIPVYLCYVPSAKLKAPRTARTAGDSIIMSQASTQHKPSIAELKQAESSDKHGTNSRISEYNKEQQVTKYLLFGPEQARQYKAGDVLRLGLCLTFKEDNLRLGTFFKDLIQDPERDIYRVGTCQQAFSDVNIQRGEYIYFEFCEDPRKLFHVIYNMSIAFNAKADILGKDARLAAMGILFNGTREQFDDAGRVATQFFTDARDCGLMVCDSAEIPVYLCYVPYVEPKAPRTARTAEDSAIINPDNQATKN